MSREFFHLLLDEALDQTKEGESFLGGFVNKVIASNSQNCQFSELYD
jgi:hypothetical protein